MGSNRNDQMHIYPIESTYIYIGNYQLIYICICIYTTYDQFIVAIYNSRDDDVQTTSDKRVTY